MSPINVNPVRGNIRVVSETDLSGMAGDTSGPLPASTGGLQAVGAIVPPGGLHPIAGGPSTASIFSGDTLAKIVQEGLKLDPNWPAPPTPSKPPLAVPGGLQGVCRP